MHKREIDTLPPMVDMGRFEYNELKSLQKSLMMRRCGMFHKSFAIDYNGILLPCSVLKKLGFEIIDMKTVDADRFVKIVSEDCMNTDSYFYVKDSFPKRCRECDVFEWCINCLDKLNITASIGKEHFQRYCDINKAYLTKLVWEV